MSSNFDFLDVLQTMLPKGAAWQPSQESLGNLSGKFTFVASTKIILSSSANFLDIEVEIGSRVQFSGTVSNNTIFTVLNVTLGGLLLIVAETPTDEIAKTATAVNLSDTRGGYFRRLLGGMAAGHQTVYEYLRELAYLREPLLTPILSDLEKEYGLLTNTTLTEAERREALHGIVYAPINTGSESYLEEQLQASGFNVQVHVNSPAVDPGLFLGGGGGELITNNINYENTVFAARQKQALWSFVFFIGGDAVRDTNGALLTIAPIVISDELRGLFRELVLKYKPLYSWAVAVINDVDYFTFSDNDEMIPDAPRGFADDEQTQGGYWWNHSFGPLFLIDDVTYELIVDDVSGEHLLEE